MGKKKFKFKRNENGINIKVCCASCKRRKMTEECRLCELTSKEVKSSRRCKKWEMNSRLQNAGMGIGKVKSWRYLSYYRERYIEQREALIDGRITAAQIKSAIEIRKEYEEEYGSVFIDL